MSYLLDHIRVVDAASFLAGPSAATVLADFGADVVKVEPLAGDGYRRLVGSHPVDYHWLLTSRNKRSLALNLDAPAGRDILHRLVRGADVVTCNFIGEQLERFGMDYETIRAVNPRIVYAHMTGYGEDGPDVARRSFDVTAWWARTGLMDFVRNQGGDPAHSAPGMGDHASGMSLFGAIMLGLYRRQRTGEGANVSTSLVANGVWSNGMALQGVWAGVDIGARKQRTGIVNPFTGIYRSADGRYLVLAMINVDREWPGLARALGRSDWLADERFTDWRAIVDNRRALRDLIAGAIGAIAIDEVCERLDAEAITYSRVLGMSEVVEDAQLAANEVIVDTGDPGEDYPKTVASPIRMAGEPKRPPARAPAVGAHSVEILAGLGLDAEAIDALVDDGVVGVPPAQAKS